MLDQVVVEMLVVLVEMLLVGSLATKWNSFSPLQVAGPGLGVVGKLAKKMKL